MEKAKRKVRTEHRRIVRNQAGSEKVPIQTGLMIGACQVVHQVIMDL